MTALTTSRPGATGSAITAPAVAPPGAFVRHVIALAKRSLIKTWRTPEALIDVTLQPVISWPCSRTSSVAPSPAGISTNTCSSDGPWPGWPSC